MMKYVSMKNDTALCGFILKESEYEIELAILNELSDSDLKEAYQKYGKLDKSIIAAVCSSRKHYDSNYGFQVFSIMKKEIKSIDDHKLPNTEYLSEYTYKAPSGTLMLEDWTSTSEDNSGWYADEEPSESSEDESE